MVEGMNVKEFFNNVETNEIDEMCSNCEFRDKEKYCVIVDSYIGDNYTCSYFTRMGEE